MKVQCKPGSWKCERPSGRSPGGQSWAQLVLQAASLKGASLKPRKVVTGTVPGVSGHTMFLMLLWLGPGSSSFLTSD